MDLDKKYLFIVVVDVLLLIFLALISFRFLTTQVRKTKEVNPEILAQYTLSLEVDEFLELVEKIEKK